MKRILSLVLTLSMLLSCVLLAEAEAPAKLSICSPDNTFGLSTDPELQQAVVNMLNEACNVDLEAVIPPIGSYNDKLETMFQSNVNYYHELVKYIVAGEQGCQEIDDYMQQLQQQLDQTGDQALMFELQSLNQAKMMLEQRTQDLRTAESVAMQSIPMLKTMQFSNMNLVRKINSAFIVTLPVFSFISVCKVPSPVPMPAPRAPPVAFTSPPLIVTVPVIPCSPPPMPAPR